jgi:hypothetical protein
MPLGSWTTSSRDDGSGGAESVLGVGAPVPVVDLAVGGAADRVDPEDPPRRIVAGEAGLDVVDQFGLVDDGVGLGFDEADDGLSEACVGDADDDGVVHRVVGLEDLFDLFG